MPALPRSDEHNWLEYDEHHRGCPRCGLRVFLSPTGRGWVLVNYYGQPTSNLLADVSGGFGSCRPPLQSSDLVVLIDYTGDPDRFPGCERFMHRIKDAPIPTHPSAAGGAALVQLGSVLPVCGYRPEFWELGPPRKHQGWTWCADCFPLEKIKARRSERKQERELPPPRAPELPHRRPLALPSGLELAASQAGFGSADMEDEKPKRRQSRNVMHLIDDDDRRVRNAGCAPSQLAVCGMVGVKTVHASTFACLPESATGKDPRRCGQCERVRKRLDELR